MNLSRRRVLQLTSLPLLATAFQAVGASQPFIASASATSAGDVEAALSSVTHPYLLVTEDAFTTWPDLAATAGSPWQGMLQDAINDSRTFPYTNRADGTDAEHTTLPGVPVATSPVQLSSAANCMTIVTSSALVAYLADPDARDNHLDILERMLRHFGLYVAPYLGLGTNLAPGTTGGWDSFVVPTSALVNMVMVLDIAHDDLSARGTLATHEATVRDAYDWLWTQAADEGFVWRQGLHGSRAIGALYFHEYAQAEQAITDYVSHQSASLEADGVFLGGAYYANERYVPPQGKRDNKLHAVDVLEHLGLATFYDDPRWINFYEWVFGYSYSPVTRRSPDGATERKDYYIFGDTFVSGIARNETYENNIHGASADFYKAGRFGKKAFAWAGAAVGRPTTPSGRFWNFAFYEGPFPADLTIPSRYFPSGNTVMREPGAEAANRRLSASIWSPIRANTTAGHARYDTNSIHLTAYGEHVLRGSGYPGYTPMIDNPEYWLHSRSHNTAMVDGAKHVLRYGAGFDAGQSGVPEVIFGAGVLDYAEATSGQALPNGRHSRALLQIVGNNGMGGYWILQDEVISDDGIQAELALHPASSTLVEIAPSWLYRSRMDIKRAVPGSEVDLTLALATEPTGLLIEPGIFGAISGGHDDCEYLAPSYAIPGSGTARVLTALFPSEPGVSIPNISRATIPGGSGITLSLNDTADTSWVSDGVADVVLGDTTARGLGGWQRHVGSHVTAALLRRGSSIATEFASGRVEWQSEAPLSVLLTPSSLAVLAPQSTWVSVRASAGQLAAVATLTSDPAHRRSVGDRLRFRMPRGLHKLTW
ncbi:heparinase II/III family protein [Microlunatus sp. GCM10028923]|uniref:heparinase II/III domain-containing protein n=1 Tax=Microlunatus sp. GCM10028923 TaxID=3273400 RepID=UPI00361FE16B